VTVSLAYAPLMLIEQTYLYFLILYVSADDEEPWPMNLRVPISHPPSQEWFDDFYGLDQDNQGAGR
jgi:hypothetical protein